jgi:hypothetical protein
MITIGKYHCEKCNYHSNKCDFEKHILSKKHNSEATSKPKKYFCKFCPKTYASNSGLRKHNNKCVQNNNSIAILNEAPANIKEENQDLMEEIKRMKTRIDELSSKKNESEIEEIKNMMIELIKNQQSQIVTMNNNNDITDLKVMMQEILKNQKQPTTIINANNNVINNNFNINLFLKEECNEALNMDIFAKNIMYEFGNVQEMLTDYVKGSISILKKNWEQIPLNKRPMHYLEGEDPHQQIFHIRHNNEWKIETELNWLKQINADDDDVLEKETLYFALKQLDKGKIIHLGYVHNCNELYKNNHNRITREVTRVDYKMKLYDEVIKMITLDPNNIDNPGKICRR